MALTLASYIKDGNTLDPEAFRARHPHHVLVVEPFAVEEEPELSTSAGGDFAGGLPMVYPIARQDSHALGDRVTIGRTGNNDIHINAPDVSKYHAYLVREGDTFSYVDADSKFGSWVNDAPVAAGERVRLSSGDRLRIASVKATIFDPEGFQVHVCRGRGQRA
ncbi:MAG: FHA domain-containing protein [Planctomycetota bacterium]